MPDILKRYQHNKQQYEKSDVEPVTIRIDDIFDYNLLIWLNEQNGNTKHYINQVIRNIKDMRTA